MIEDRLAIDFCKEKELKIRYEYQVIRKYLDNKVNGWNIEDFFLENGYKRIICYAITDITFWVCKDISTSTGQTEILYVCDKNPEKYHDSICQKAVVSIDKMVNDYLCGEIDKIVVCHLFKTNEIFKDLMDRGVLQRDIISVADVIYSLW